ncbi:c-type cytochrome [Allosphingosinicella sp.]|uniref:c-type cytochrome n=1 Tax=Allosphingosinicella sp. TaxID=2823234 RepID=UPI003784688D
MKKSVLAVVAVAAICGAAYAQRPAASAAATIAARQGNYKQMAAALKGIGDQLRATAPDIAQIRPRAALLADRSVHVLAWFPHGTGPEAGIRTRARPDIWANAAGFRQRGAAFVVAARALNAAARAGDLGQVRTALRDVQRACSACHDDFRAPE